MKNKGLCVSAATALLGAALLASCGSEASASAATIQAGSVANAQAAYLQLRRAADALGGSDRLLSTERMEFELSGETHHWLQGERADSSRSDDYGGKTFVDWTNGHLHLAHGNRGREHLFGLSLDVDTRDFNFASRTAYSPHYVVRAVIAEPAQLALREANPDRIVLSGALHGRHVQLSLDRHALPVELKYLDEDPIDGDSQSIIRYSNYSQDGGWRLPARIEHRRADRLLVDACRPIRS